MSKYNIVEHRIPCQHIREYPRALANSQEDILHLAVKQYIPKDNPNPQPGDVTIIAAHANAFPKELYEPLWDDLLSRAQKQGWRIRSIWIADVAWQGESGVVNESLLGNDPNWNDHARDLLHMINVKRDEMPRPLIGIGHSMGGNQITHLALLHPRLITTLILIDPVIQNQSAEVNKNSPKSINYAALSTFRRTRWPSLEDLTTSVRKAPFSRTWDTRVANLWIQNGHRPGPTLLEPNAKPPQMVLKTPPAHEVHTFLRANYAATGSNGNPLNRTTHPDLNPSLPFTQPFYRAEAPQTFARLPELRPSTLYIFGSKSDVSDSKLNALKVDTTGTGVGGSGGAKEGRVKGITLQDVGHLVAMEAPQQTAETIAEWVGPEIENWRLQKREWDDWARNNTLVQKQEVDDEWKGRVGPLPVRGKKRVVVGGESKL